MAEFQPTIDKITGAKNKGPDAIVNAKNKDAKEDAAEVKTSAASKPTKTEETPFKVFCMVDKAVVFNPQVKFEPFKWYELSHPLHVRAARNQARRYNAGIVITKEGMAKPPGA